GASGEPARIDVREVVLVDLALGNVARVVTVSSPRPKRRYGNRPSDGSRAPVIGVDHDETGTPLATFSATLASPVVGWAESTTVVVPEPLTTSFPSAGTVL